MQLIYNIVRTTTESERCMYNCTKKSKYASIKKVSSKILKLKKTYLTESVSIQLYKY
jgi:hypothetical protein